MLGLVGTFDKPTSDKVVPRRSYLPDIAGNPGGGISHGWHFQFRHSFHTLKGKRRRKTNLISIKMLGGHVWIVHRHSKKNSLRKNTLGFGPFNYRFKAGNYPVQIGDVRNPNISDLPFGDVDQSHWKSSFLFFRAHGQNIFLSGGEVFANLALFDFAAFSKLTWRSVVAGSEATRKSGR